MGEPWSLDTYDITPARGFLCPFDADEIALPAPFDLVVQAAEGLPHGLPTGRIRSLLERIPEPDMTVLAGAAMEPAARLAMVRYSFLVQAYVWGEPEAPARLPANLARPIVWLADRLGQKPLLPYSGYVLDNWGRIDPDRPIDLDNIWMIQPFLSGQDEAWFVLVHVAIEARAGALLALAPSIIGAAAEGDAGKAEQGLAAMAPVWADINAIFDRMPERCDPYIYFHRVRPYIHGWKDNPALGGGLIYEGVEAYGGAPQAFRGQTGSQSSIVPAMDALLGIGHADDPLKSYLDELHDYRPPKHRAFIDRLREESRLRELAQSAGSKPLVEAYNAIVQEVARFRTRHLEYAASYIHKQAKGGPGNDTEVGTGGTPFMKYLKKHRDEAEAHLIRI